MEIKKLLPGDSDFHLFEALPKRLYPAGSIRHKQHDAVSSDFLTACYIAVEDDEVKARAAVYTNPDLVYNGLSTRCIGNYECVDDPAVAASFLTHLERETAAPKCFLLGPMNGSTWENYRFSLDHDSPNFFLEPYHHLYYNAHFREAGMEPIAGYGSSMDRRLSFDFTDVTDREQELLAKGMTIRPIDMERFEAELEKLYTFITTAFKDNFLYSPISRERFFRKYREAAAIIHPEYVLIAEDRHSGIVGFIFCYDDLFNTSEKSIVIKTLARHPSDEWRGLGQVLGNRIVRLAKQRGYASQIHAFMINEGASTFTPEKFKGNLYKNYVLYGKTL